MKKKVKKFNSFVSALQLEKNFVNDKSRDQIKENQWFIKTEAIFWMECDEKPKDKEENDEEITE